MHTLARMVLNINENEMQVITVPAFFNTLQKAATITAAGMAGVHNVALIQGCLSTPKCLFFRSATFCACRVLEILSLMGLFNLQNQLQQH